MLNCKRTGIILFFYIYFLVVCFDFGVAATLPECHSEIIEDIGTEDMDDFCANACSLGCAVGWHAKATSSLVSKTSRYDVRNLNDCDWKTAWAGGKENDSIGEKIIFVFSPDVWPKEFEQPEVSFWGFRIVNGYIKNKKIWQENSRVKKARISLNGKPKVNLIFKDSMKVQEVSFDPFNVRVNDKVSFELLEVYRGTKYRNATITELTPLGAH